MMNEIIIQYQTQSIYKQTQSYRNESPNSENRNATQPNNTEQTVTQ